MLLSPICGLLAAKEPGDRIGPFEPACITAGAVVGGIMMVPGASGSRIGVSVGARGGRLGGVPGNGGGVGTGVDGFRVGVGAGAWAGVMFVAVGSSTNFRKS